MARKLPGLTVADHIICGQTLSATHVALTNIVNLHARGSRTARAAERCIKSLMTVRSELDDKICGLTANSDPRNLAITVYYRGLVRDEAQTNPGDAFAGWSDPL